MLSVATNVLLRTSGMGGKVEVQSSVEVSPREGSSETPLGCERGRGVVDLAPPLMERERGMRVICLQCLLVCTSMEGSASLSLHS